MNAKISKKKGLIISGFGGVGKTTLAKKYRNVIDLESGPYKYDYANIPQNQFEILKGKMGRTRNPEYPGNYVNAILDAIEKYDIVCVRYNGDEQVDFYDTYGLDYIVCYPTKQAYKNYIKRFEERGNSKDWIAKNKRYYQICFERCKNFKGDKIVLHDHETLEDALIKRHILLVPKNN